jgi:transposase
MMRKQHSPSFKTQVVIAALRETKTLTQIAAENEIHPTLVTKWKTEAVSGLLDVFERGAKREENAAAQEKKVAELYEQIGRLTTQVNWLKKKSGLEPDPQ